MIISRTPFRISFAGGGTDLRSFYRHEPGEVVSAAIDKYLWVFARRQLGLVEHRYRLNYSRVEFRHALDEIEHPIIREALRHYGVDFPVEVTTVADVPAYTGLGSSSAFAVGLLHALRTLLGLPCTPGGLAEEAARLEVDTLGRCVGKQDHYAAAFGGLNRFTFRPDESVVARNLPDDSGLLPALAGRLLLSYTGIRRDAAEVLSVQSPRVGDGRAPALRRLKGQALDLWGWLSAARHAFLGDGDGGASGEDLGWFGESLRRGWEAKRALPGVSSPRIDRWVDLALSAGASGGKLLGAGGGGFLLFYAEPERQPAVKAALAELARVEVGFDHGGTRIVYADAGRTPAHLLGEAA